jgi:hypothetical protein
LNGLLVLEVPEHLAPVVLRVLFGARDERLHEGAKGLRLCHRRGDAFVFNERVREGLQRTLAVGRRAANLFSFLAVSHGPSETGD